MASQKYFFYSPLRSRLARAALTSLRQTPSMRVVPLLGMFGALGRWMSGCTSSSKLDRVAHRKVPAHFTPQHWLLYHMGLY